MKYVDFSQALVFLWSVYLLIHTTFIFLFIFSGNQSYRICLLLVQCSFDWVALESLSPDFFDSFRIKLYLEIIYSEAQISFIGF